MEIYTSAFSRAWGIVLQGLGILTALLIPLAVLLAGLGLLALAFDLATDAYARYMRRKNKQPKTRIGKIICSHSSDV